MLSVSSISQSAMSAAQASMDVAASNIASASTSGYQRAQAPVAAAAQVEESVRLSAAESGRSMETDVVGMLQEKNAFLANLAVFKNSERLVGGLISLNS